MRFCILGAGPAGLTFAAALQRAGCDSFVLFEKESQARGLCRSAIVDGAPLGIGGGHFLDVRRQRVLDFLFGFMRGEEWREFKRFSTIRIRDVEVEHPLEGNLWQLPLDAQVEFLESIARAGSAQGAPEPTTFDAWMRWKLGDRIADEYMLPYNRKIWSMPLSDLGVYWMHKLPSVSFRDTLRSCLERKSGGTLPGHGPFLDPVAHGCGEVWRRIAASLGERFVPGHPISSVDVESRIIDGVINADVIVSTTPWTIWPHIAKLPEPIRAAIEKLIQTNVHVDYQPGNLASGAHWIYSAARRSDNARREGSIFVRCASQANVVNASNHGMFTPTAVSGKSFGPFSPYSREGSGVSAA